MTYKDCETNLNLNLPLSWPGVCDSAFHSNFNLSKAIFTIRVLPHVIFIIILNLYFDVCSFTQVLLAKQLNGLVKSLRTNFILMPIALCFERKHYVMQHIFLYCGVVSFTNKLVFDECRKHLGLSKCLVKHNLLNIKNEE